MNDPRSRHTPDPLRASYTAPNVELRLASAEDRKAALAIDDGYTTGAMWQMRDRVAAGGPLDSIPGGEDALGVVFLPVRLPRPRRVDGLFKLRPVQQRLAAWEAAGCMMVVGPRTRGPIPDQFALLSGAPPAEYQVPAPREIWGYVVSGAVPTARIAWLSELVVVEEHRRHGVGTMLLDAVIAWARAPHSLQGAGGMAALMVELSPRNGPAIDFCRARGFAFSGYTDYSSAGGDTTLLFSRPIG